MPGSFRSSRYRPWPVMKRRSSRRLTEVPRVSTAIGSSSGRSGLGAGWLGGTGTHRDRGLADRTHDVVIAGAATDVALDPVADLGVRGGGVAGEQVGRGHDHARRAEPALEAVLGTERLLERMERAVR